MPPATLQVSVPTFTPAGAALAPAAMTRPAAVTAAPTVKRKVLMALLLFENRRTRHFAGRSLKRGWPFPVPKKRRKLLFFNGLTRGPACPLRKTGGADTGSALQWERL